jgi:cardiolipin synthase
VGHAGAFWTHLGRHGIEVRLFHRLSHRPLYQAFRDHRKILVVDREVAFTGGMNIADEYAVGDGGTPAWRDTHAHRRLGGLGDGGGLSEGWVRRRRAVGAAAADRRAAAGVPTQVLDSRPGRGHVESAAVLARSSVRRGGGCGSPTPTAPRGGGRLLAGAVRHGVDVRLLLPGPTDAAGATPPRALRQALRRGVRLWEYQPSVLHAKTLVADDFVAVVGSSNLDYRSFRFNAECNLLMLGDQPAQALTDAFEADLRSPPEIDLESGGADLLAPPGRSAGAFPAPILNGATLAPWDDCADSV